MNGVCLYKILKVIVIKDKMAGSVISIIVDGWCYNFRYLTIGFFVDNGGEFRSFKMEEFFSKLG